MSKLFFKMWFMRKEQEFRKW